MINIFRVDQGHQNEVNLIDMKENFQNRFPILDSAQESQEKIPDDFTTWSFSLLNSQSQVLNQLTQLFEKSIKSIITGKVLSFEDFLKKQFYM